MGSIYPSIQPSFTSKSRRFFSMCRLPDSADCLLTLFVSPNLLQFPQRWLPTTPSARTRPRSSACAPRAVTPRRARSCRPRSGAFSPRRASAPPSRRLRGARALPRSVRRAARAGRPALARSFGAGDPAEREAARDFFDEWGFVVFRDVLTPAECAATEAEVWRTLEARTPGLARDDPATYARLPAERYGLPEERAVFTPQMRAQPPERAAVRRARRAIARGGRARPPARGRTSRRGAGAGQRRRLAGPVVPARRAAATPRGRRPTRACTSTSARGATSRARRAARAGAAAERRRALAYAPGSLTDFRAEINGVAFERGGPHRQGLLNIVDNEEAGGGTSVVPRFHRALRRVARRARRVARQPRRPAAARSARSSSRPTTRSTRSRGACRSARQPAALEPDARARPPRTRVAPRAHRAVACAASARARWTQRARPRARAVRRELAQAGSLGALGPLAPHVFFGVDALGAARPRCGPSPGARFARRRAPRPGGARASSSSSSPEARGARWFASA